MSDHHKFVKTYLFEDTPNYILGVKWVKNLEVLKCARCGLLLHLGQYKNLNKYILQHARSCDNVIVNQVMAS
jgi:hypothetical protein